MLHVSYTLYRMLYISNMAHGYEHVHPLPLLFNKEQQEGYDEEGTPLRLLRIFKNGGNFRHHLEDWNKI